MKTTRLGRTNLTVTRTAFGVLPIQRVPLEQAVTILQSAYEGGINFFDTARAYSDSEQKLGAALGAVRSKIVIATKTTATTRDGVWKDLEASLKHLQTDWVDILQLHNPKALPDPEDKNSSYTALEEAKAQGLIRHIGVSQHALARAREAVISGLYETVQFPFSMISNDEDLALIDFCAQHDVGLIGMKALAGGLITNARAAFAFLHQYENVVPIWGIQHQAELDEFLALEADPPALDEAVWTVIEENRKALQGDFCRGCGYCLPCPAEIPIPMAARMGLLLRRAPAAPFGTDHWQQQMKRIDNCTECGACRERCPYGLDTPVLLKKHLHSYEAWLNGEGK